MSEDGSDGVEHRAEPDVRRVVGEAGQDPGHREPPVVRQVVAASVRVTDAGRRDGRLLRRQL